MLDSLVLTEPRPLLVPHAPGRSAARLGGAALGEGTLLELGVMPSQMLSASVMTMACEMRWP